MTNIRNQRGVALLFALGIISLMLVTGLAFLGNALISQKVAINNETLSSARLFARSAAERALAHLMTFNMIQSKYSAQYHAEDVSSVFSRRATLAASGHDSDQLTGPNSKLNINYGHTANWYNGSDSRARWIYVHENGRESNGSGEGHVTDANKSPIVARFAYQVLPHGGSQVSKSRLPLYAVTAGVTQIAGETPAAANPRIPHKHRWGMDVDELVIPGLEKMFYHYWGNGNDRALAPQHEFDNFINLLSLGGTDDPKTFYGNSADVENRKRWLKHFFLEGKAQMAMESFYSETDTTGKKLYYPRFNIGEFTKYFINTVTPQRYQEIYYKDQGSWYQRFLSPFPESVDAEKAAIAAIANGESVIDRLTKWSADQYNRGFYYDSEYSAAFGLPFLRRIGHDEQKGGFESIKDLRKQIAANLNDYCDGDSIPTSDVPASGWKDLTGATSGLPSYTGNEKTPYINEVGFGFKLDKATIGIDGKSFKFKSAMFAEVIGEIVNMYKLGTNEGITAANLYGKLSGLTVFLKVTASGNATVVEEKEDGTVGEFKSTFDFTADTNAESEQGKYEFVTSASPIDLSIPIIVNPVKGGTGNHGPYWIGHQTLSTEPSVSIDLTKSLLKNDGANWINAEEGDKEVRKVHSIELNKLSSLKVVISKVNFKFGNFVLGITPVGESVERCVDFVKNVSAAEHSVDNFTGEESNNFFGGKTLRYDPDDPDLQTKVETLLDNETKDDSVGFAYAGAIQAIDPRQNLNLRVDQDNKNDWANRTEPSLKNVTLPDEEKPSWKTNTSSDKLTGIASRKKGMNDNKSNPSDPRYADGSEMKSGSAVLHDIETATDPAWLGDSVGQHVSTAVIRNKPMRSPWELGFIHRGIPFQTINLKKAGGIDGSELIDNTSHKKVNFESWENAEGTRYQYGDAGILDQIKMTDRNKSYGKVDFSVLRDVAKPSWWVGNDASGFASMNKDLFMGLFDNLRGQTAMNFLEESNGDIANASSTVSGTVLTGRGNISMIATIADDAIFRSQLLNDDTLKPVFTQPIIAGNTNDAASEEVIGKTINLLEAKINEEMRIPSNTCKILVIAQVIKDIEAPREGIAKWDYSDIDNVHLRLNPNEAKIGQFDAVFSNGVYYDEIWGECRMLVTVEKNYYIGKDASNNPVTRARLRVKQIEYLD